MPAAMYKQLSEEMLGDWFCPGCVQTKQHLASTSYRQHPSSLSSDTESSDGETNSTVGFGSPAGIQNQSNLMEFTLTPAQLVITPAPSSRLDAANQSFQSTMATNQWREWDTSLATQETYLPIRQPQLHQEVESLSGQPILENASQSNSPLHGQNLSFGDFLPQTPSDAVNCNMQLRDSDMLP
jgi:hypothetical protein